MKNKDEFGQLAQSFNSFTQSLTQIVKQVSSSSEQVAASSEELSASAEESKSTSEHISGAMQMAADSNANQSSMTEKSAESINVSKYRSRCKIITKTAQFNGGNLLCCRISIPVGGRTSNRH